MKHPWTGSVMGLGYPRQGPDPVDCTGDNRSSESAGETIAANLGREGAAVRQRHAQHRRLLLFDPRPMAEGHDCASVPRYANQTADTAEPIPLPPRTPRATYTRRTDSQLSSKPTAVGQGFDLANQAEHLYSSYWIPAGCTGWRC
jgi:hypothetical protein